MSSPSPDVIYFDNAATTPMLAEVFDRMRPYLTECFGNPSSAHVYGQRARLAVEQARREIATLIHAQPAEIYFTSGATESTSTVLYSAVYGSACERVISARTEHSSTVRLLEHWQRRNLVEVVFLPVDSRGYVCLDTLQRELQNSKKKTIVSLLHTNNEIGTIQDFEAIGKLCQTYGALLHGDVVQTIAHFRMDMRTFPTDFFSASAHKFHGPKGVGILYVRLGRIVEPLFWGGGQEKNLRSGTENVGAIVGAAEALKILHKTVDQDKTDVLLLKQRLWEGILSVVPQAVVNGDADFSCSLYSLLNVGFPRNDQSDMLATKLDLQRVCVSSGSACSSGAQAVSHVMEEIGATQTEPIRFSLSRFNTASQVDRVIHVLRHIFG